MFTKYTYQDWEKSTNKPDLIGKIVDAYKECFEFQHGLDANEYMAGRNPAVMDKVIAMKRAFAAQTAEGEEALSFAKTDIVGNRISNNFFERFVTQQNQYLLGYGVTLDDEKKKEALGKDFDIAMQQCGEFALAQGVSFGFWNNGELQPIEAASDCRSGAVALLDEETSDIKVLIQFWQINSEKPTYYRLFEIDGITKYKKADDKITEIEPKRAYVNMVRTDATGRSVTGTKNYGTLPIIPFYANSNKESELKPNIQSKIDAYDICMSDFFDNLERANEVYWALSHFDGSVKDIIQQLRLLDELKIAIPSDDGTTAGAEPRTIDVPYNARKEALALLKKELYADYMALDMDELTGGSLTNVAINAATKNMDLKADKYEYQAADFVRGVMALAGVESTVIEFRRNRIENEIEKADNDLKLAQTVQLMAADIGQKEALKHYPLIEHDKKTIDDILADTQAETVGGQPSIEELQAQIDRMQQETANGQPQIVE